jgi:hypothetical protein
METDESDESPPFGLHSIAGRSPFRGEGHSAAVVGPLISLDLTLCWKHNYLFSWSTVFLSLFDLSLCLFSRTIYNGLVSLVFKQSQALELPVLA